METLRDFEYFDSADKKLLAFANKIGKTFTEEQNACLSSPVLILTDALFVDRDNYYRACLKAHKAGEGE